MKSLLLVLAVGALALGLALPRLGGACDGRGSALSGNAGSSLDLDSTSATPARLLVEPGPGTLADRGRLAGDAVPATLHGAFRYQQEVGHRVLYVYDDVQDLLVRVIDPAAVRRQDLHP